jgi:hypothetical protein
MGLDRDADKEKNSRKIGSEKAGKRLRQDIRA